MAHDEFRFDYGCIPHCHWVVFIGVVSSHVRTTSHRPVYVTVCCSASILSITGVAGVKTKSGAKNLLSTTVRRIFQWDIRERPALGRCFRAGVAPAALACLLSSIGYYFNSNYLTQSKLI